MWVRHQGQRSGVESLEADLGEPDVTNDVECVAVLVGQAVVELSHVLVVHGNLESLLLTQDKDVEVGVGSKGEVTNGAVLLTPLSILAVVTHKDVDVTRKAESDVNLEQDVSSVMHSALQVDVKPGGVREGHTADVDHTTRGQSARDSGLEGHRRIENWSRWLGSRHVPHGVA